VNRLADTMAARYREDRAAIPADSIDGRHVDLRYRTIVSRSAADTAGRVTVEAAASNTLKSLSPILSAAGALVGGGGGALYGWGATGWDGEFAAIVEIPGALLMAVGSALLVAGVGCGIASLFHHPQETPADQQGVWRLAPAASPALDGRAPAAADGAPDGGASDRDAGTPTGGAD
jgi:hypothetical protein